MDDSDAPSPFALLALDDKLPVGRAEAQRHPVLAGQDVHERVELPLIARQAVVLLHKQSLDLGDLLVF